MTAGRKKIRQQSARFFPRVDHIFRCITDPFLHLIILFALLTSELLPQNTGKISGRVFDAAAQKALPGANVVIPELQTGAATDLNGHFAIMRLYPGSYTLKVTFIGYSPITITDVRVSIDKTTFLEIPMQIQGIATQEVVVTAKKPIVEKDKTFSSTNFEADEISEIPSEGLRDILDLNASLQRNANGTYSLRGGGSFDINFMIDGVSQENSNTGVPGTNYMGEKSNTSWKYDFNPLGVKQMELISGGFSAEYGNAQSGVVKIVTKEGTPAFHGEMRIEYRGPGQYHFGDYLYGRNNFEWQRWGQLENWFTATAFQLPQSSQIGTPSYIDGIPVNLFYFSDSLHTYLPYSRSINDSLAVAYYNQWLASHSPGGKILSQVTDYNWTVSGSGQLSSGDSVMLYRKNWLYSQVKNPTNKLGVYDYRQLSFVRYLFGLGGPIGQLEGCTFFLSGEKRRKPTRLPTYEKYNDYENINLTTVLRVSSALRVRTMLQYQHSRNGVFSGSDDIRWASPVGSVSFNTGKQKYLLISIAPKDEYAWIQSLMLTYVFRPETFLEWTISHTYEQYAMNTEPLSTTWQAPQGVWDEGYTRLVWDPSATAYNQDVRTDIYATKLDFTHQFSPQNHLKAGLQATGWKMHYSSVSSAYANALIYKSGFAEYYKANPIYAAGYVQDKMEYKGLIANLGLRLEGFNNNADVPADPYDVFYPGTMGPTDVGSPETQKPQTHWALSPRAGLSFPIGERTAFRLQYGHFYAMPIFRHTLSRSTWQGWIMVGNPNLDFRKTISYEFGLQHSLFGTHRLDVVAYYNDRTSQTINIRRHFDQGSYGRSVTDPYAATYVNTGYGATRGIEIALDRVAVSNWRYRFKYALSRTSSGAYGPWEIWENDDPNKPFDMRPFILRANDNITSEDKTHAFSAIVTYSWAKKSGPHIGSFFPLANSALSLSYMFRSGSPFTYVTSYDEFFDVENNRRYPLEYETDLSYLKSIKMLGFEVTIACRIQNLFNNRWLTPFDATVEKDDLNRWVMTGLTWDDPNHPNYKYNYHRAYRNTPREIYFNLGLGF